MNTQSFTSVTQILNLSTLDSKMTYKDLKIECIIRGLGFDKIINSDFPNLAKWLVKNRDINKDRSLLTSFDDFVEGELLKRGKDDLIHPSLRLSYVGDIENRDKIVKSKIKKIISKPKGKIKKDKNGIKKNTKKSLTFKLQRKGYKLEKVIRRVLRRFPDANEKSIKIWYRKSERLSKL